MRGSRIRAASMSAVLEEEEDEDGGIDLELFSKRIAFFKVPVEETVRSQGGALAYGRRSSVA